MTEAQQMKPRASNQHFAFGIDGAARASFASHNLDGDIDALLAGLEHRVHRRERRRANLSANAGAGSDKFIKNNASGSVRSH